ncbi:hypothetical protein [Adhaeribacter soli]|uniref:Uncharacterized protein n=1 Tax=Adhaeribacter soli TaxID=2607655 RepID=A0A5N1J638_9BACT|nr:hypothetical protein [Adhaeribacter soli]KAA9346177.1 hypothetical protein F0P94_03595 [Adhaeribacter soli]
MPTIHLNNLNNIFELHGNTGRRSLELEKVVLMTGAVPGLQLQVLDEKNLSMYTHDLQPDTSSSEIYINRKFVFYDHLTVQIVSTTPGTVFEAEVYYQ